MSEAKPGAAQSTNSTESSKVPAAPRSRARFLGPVLSVAGLTLAALYPLIIYALLSAGLMWPCALVIVLAAAALWRVRRTKISLAALVVAAVLAALTLATDEALALKLYPVIVNLCWLAFFAASLFSTPAVELFARMKYPQLPVGAQRYCRLATRAWCVFFIANAAVALDSALFRSDAWWALYNGAIAYGAIALMFAGEYIARRLYARRHGLPL